MSFPRCLFRVRGSSIPLLSSSHYSIIPCSDYERVSVGIRSSSLIRELQKLVLVAVVGTLLPNAYPALVYKLSFDNDGPVNGDALHPYQAASGDVSPDIIDRLDPIDGRVPKISQSLRLNSGLCLNLTPPVSGNAGYFSRNTTGYVPITALTVEAAFRVYSHTSGQKQGLVCQFGVGGIAPSLMLQGGTTDRPSISFGLNQAGASVTYLPPSALVGDWHTVAGVYRKNYNSTQSCLELYLDGILVATTIYDTPTQATVFVKGGIAFGVDAPNVATKRVLNGQLDNCAISTDALTPASFVFPPTPNTTYGSAPPPPAGQHPRIVLTPSELPLLRQRVLYEPAKSAYTSLIQNAESLAPGGALYSLVQSMQGGTTLTDDDYQKLSIAMGQGALAALISNDLNLVVPTLSALLAYVSNVPSDMPNMDHSRNIIGIGLAYDYLSPFMNAAEQSIVRDWLAEAVDTMYVTLQNRVYGFGAAYAAQRNYNWIPFIMGSFATATLSIEGETGYNPAWFTDSMQSFHDFLDYGISPTGCPSESIWYFAYGMSHGSYLLDAMARRGHSAWDHPRLSQIPNYWTNDMFPFGPDFNSMQDTSDLQMGCAEIFHRFTLAKPGHALMPWVYKQYGANPNGGPLYPSSTVLWGTAPDLTAEVADLNLPITRYFAENGLLYARSSWAPDATYFTFQSDPALPGPSHGHADRNSFTMASMGRIWAMDGGGWAPQDIFHNLVFIDGKGQGWHAQYGKIVDYVDATWAIGITGDAKDDYGYSVRANSGGGATLVNGLWSIPYNPVQRAYRTAVFVKGNHPYVMITDDLVKDTSSHLYQWRMLTPQCNRIEAHVAGSLVGATLAPMDTGASVQAKLISNATPLQASFTIAQQGSYKIWLMIGHSTTVAWNTSAFLTLDTGPRTRVNLRAGDNAPLHWQQAYTDGPPSLSVGSHTLKIETAFGQCQVAAVLIAPAAYDARQLNLNPASTLPSESVLIRMADLTLPSNWQLLPADPNPPVLQVQVLSPASGVQVQPEIFQRIRPDTGADSGPVNRLTFSVNSINPKFRVVLLPRRSMDAPPQFTTGANTATLSWPDGTTDTWTFGATVAVQRTGDGSTKTFEIDAQ